MAAGGGSQMRSAEKLKVRRAFTARVFDVRTLRLLILENSLTVGAGTLRLLFAIATNQLDVMHHVIAASMASDGKIVNRADNRIFHFLR
jgi:hypothetical protein